MGVIDAYICELKEEKVGDEVDVRRGRKVRGAGCCISRLG